MSPSIVLSVKKWISKLYIHCSKGFNYADSENAGKPKNETWRILKNMGNLTAQVLTAHQQHSIKILGYVNF